MSDPLVKELKAKLHMLRCQMAMPYNMERNVHKALADMMQAFVAVIDDEVAGPEAIPYPEVGHVMLDGAVIVGHSATGTPICGKFYETE